MKAFVLAGLLLIFALTRGQDEPASAPDTQPVTPPVSAPVPAATAPTPAATAPAPAATVPAAPAAQPALPPSSLPQSPALSPAPSQTVPREKASSTFCSRAPSRTKCPSPPTFDFIQLPAFQGRWYEIGASAGHRLVGESGDTCTQVAYALSPNSTSNISVDATSVHVSGPLASLAVQQVAVAAATACSGARSLCGRVSPDSRSRAAAAALGDVAAALESDRRLPRGSAAAANSLRQIQARVLGAMHEVESTLDLFSGTMESVQRLDGDIAQTRLLVDDHSASANLTRQRLHKLDDLVNQANALLDAVKTSATKMMDSTGAIISISTNLLVAGDFESSVRLSSASTELTASGNSMLVQLTAMHLTLKGIAAARGLVDLATSTSTNTNSTSVPVQTSIAGYATQNLTSPGKFELQLLPSLNSPVPPPASPYWVLSLRGRAAQGYRASLVYSCTQVDDNTIRQQMVVLSRYPHLPDRIVDQLLALTNSFGINTDCDDPFLFTVQHESSCPSPK